MANQVPTYYAQQYATTLMLLLQQKGSRLRGTVTEKSYTGKAASPVDQVGAIEMQDVAGRFAPMGRVDAPADRRWVYPHSKDLPQLLDSFDEAKLIIDPKSKYVENAVAAAGRQMDREIILGALGTNMTGVEGGTSTVLPSGQKVLKNFASSSNVGLTVAKLREIRRIFGVNQVDFKSEELHLAITQTQHDNLLGEAQVISRDYNDGPAVLVDGMIDRFMGFKFEITELLPYIAGGTVRQCIAYCKSGLHLGVWKDVQTDVAQRRDLTGLPWQVYLMMMMGGTRLEEKKVIEVDCQE